MSYEQLMELVVRAFETAGVAILAIGSVAALIRFLVAYVNGNRATAYMKARQGVGYSILLGLEVLIIADIVRTITIEPTLDSALFLGVIVLVRTFLSFSLEIDLDGVVPWRRGTSKITGESAP